MKNRIKNILWAIVSIIVIGMLIFVAYLRIQAHEYGALVWNILGIIILLIATYVYLLNKWEWKGKNYIFTSEELIKNCLGMKSATNSRDYEKINDILDCLYNNGLIDYEDIYIKKDNKVIAKKQLIRVSKTYNSKRK